MNGTVIQFARIECLVLIATTKLVLAKFLLFLLLPLTIQIFLSTTDDAQLHSSRASYSLAVQPDRITRRSRVSSASNELVISSIFDRFLLTLREGFGGVETDLTSCYVSTLSCKASAVLPPTSDPA